MSVLSPTRLYALIRKESLQALRDPSTLAICFFLPTLMLFIFGYGISFDSTALRVGIVLEDHGPEGREFAQAFLASPYFDATVEKSRAIMVERMQAGTLRGMVIVPQDFSRRLYAKADPAIIQVITDGSEPNTANFVQAYVSGALQTWLQNRALDAGQSVSPLLEVQVRMWFNPDATSRNVIMPGALTIIMMVIGALLTSLVIAREWERGTMEALLSTRVTRAEIILSKLVPYFVLGMVSFLLCLSLIILIFGVPFRGSWLVLMGVGALFLFNALAIGLFISTNMDNQFNAAMASLMAIFLPTTLLSGFIFEIDAMPAIIRAVTYIIPARYAVRVMHTLFLAGSIPVVVAINTLFLFLTACLFVGWTAKRTRMGLE